MKLSLLLVAAGLSLSGCLSARMATGPATIGAVRSRDIQQTLDSGNYLRALQDIEVLQKQGGGGAADPELTGYRAKAIDGVAAAFQAATAGADMVRAYRLYLSLEALNEQSRFPDWSAARVVSRLIEDRLNAGDAVSASLYFCRGVEAGVLKTAEVTALEQAFAAKGLTPLFQRLKSGQDQSHDTASMLKGTATIWVDKGIRFEGGVGLPDRAMGSGFFVDSRGYLLTNYHVIQSEVDPKYEGYSRLYVRLPRRSEERVPAKVVAWDPVFDLALLKVEVTPDFAFSMFADPKVSEGQKVLAIGSPVDPFLQNTITSGIVSATGRRRLLQMGDVIQIDAAVNPGNSGGPLLDERGDVVGIVFAGIRPFEGLNFAIPQHWIRKVLPVLMRGGEVAHAWMGAALMEDDHGLQVTYVVPGRPADRVGLRAGDLISSVNGRPFGKIKDLQEYLLDLGPDMLVKCAWQRGSETLSALLQLDKRPRNPSEVALDNDARINVLPPLFGLRLQPAGGFLWEAEYTITQVIPGSVADDTGLSEGDILSIQMWRVDPEARYALLQIFVKKRKSGYLERVIQLAAGLDIDSYV